MQLRPSSGKNNYKKFEIRATLKKVILQFQQTELPMCTNKDTSTSQSTLEATPSVTRKALLHVAPAVLKLDSSKTNHQLGWAYLHNQSRCSVGKLYHLDAEQNQKHQTHATGTTQSDQPISGISNVSDQPTVPRAHPQQGQNMVPNTHDTCTDPNPLNSEERRIYDEIVKVRAREKLDLTASDEQRQTFLLRFNNAQCKIRTPDRPHTK